MRFLDLPWDEFGETSLLLSLARRRHDALMCRCGCGQWAPESHDPMTDGEWVVVDDETVCYAGAALERWREDGDKPEPGALIRVRRFTEQELAVRRGD